MLWLLKVCGPPHPLPWPSFVPQALTQTADLPVTASVVQGQTYVGSVPLYTSGRDLEPQTFLLPSTRRDSHRVLEWTSHDGLEVCVEVLERFSGAGAFQPSAALCTTTSMRMQVSNVRAYLSFFSLDERVVPTRAAYSFLVDDVSEQDHAAGEHPFSSISASWLLTPTAARVLRMQDTKGARPVARQVMDDSNDSGSSVPPGADTRVDVFIVCVVVICGGLLVASAVVLAVWTRKSYLELKDTQGLSMLKAVAKKKKTGDE